MHASTLDIRISQIESSINKHQHLTQNVGVNEGILGFSLFYYYYYLLTKNDSYANKISYYIDLAFQKISNADVDQFEIIDLLELGRYLCFLSDKGVIDNDNITHSLLEIEKPILNYLQLKINEKDLDSISGIVAVGHYLVDSRNLNYLDNIEFIVEVIEKLSFKNNTETICWFFPMRDKNNPRIEVGFFHGISGVINFLIRVYKKNIRPDLCHTLITRAINFLLEYKLNRGINLFPFDINSNERLLYQNLNYGDFGVGYSIYECGIVLKNESFENKGIQILINSAQFKNFNNYIKDAELVYGSSGIFALLEFLEKKTNNKTFSKSKKYWLDMTLNFNNNLTPWAGYETYFNGFDDSIQVSFSHGICGIGIALINHKLNLNHEYLSFFNYR